MFARLKEERGLAAMTVLLTTSVLAVAGSVVVYTSTAELEIGARDVRSEDAFSSAEAGLDIAASKFISQPTWSSGTTQECLDNPLVPSSAGIVCEVKVTSPSNGQLVYPATGRPYVDYVVVAKAKDGPSVTRTLVSTFKLETADLPYGFFVDGDVDFGGGAKLFRESILVNGTVTSRDKIDFNWDASPFIDHDDPDLGWRFHKQRIQSDPAPDENCYDESTGMNTGCAGVFSNFQIYEKNLIAFNREIHSSSNNPASSTFPRDRDVHQRKLDDTGNALPVVTLPTDSVLELMDTAKELAKQQGLYFNYKDGSSGTTNFQPGDIGAPAREFEKNVAVYIDADAGDIIKWKVSLIPGSTDSEMLYTNSSGTRVGPVAGLLVVRGGELHLEANTKWSGSVFAPEGAFRLRGGTDCTCTIYAKGASSSGGNSKVQLTPDWFQNLPAGFAKVVKTGFFECEPFQSYPAGSPCLSA